MLFDYLPFQFEGCSRRYREGYRFYSSSNEIDARDAQDCEERCISERNFECKAFAFSYNNNYGGGSTYSSYSFGSGGANLYNNRNCQLSQNQLNNYGSASGYNNNNELQADSVNINICLKLYQPISFCANMLTETKVVSWLLFTIFRDGQSMKESVFLGSAVVAMDPEVMGEAIMETIIITITMATITITITTIITMITITTTTTTITTITTTTIEVGFNATKAIEKVTPLIVELFHSAGQPHPWMIVLMNVTEPVKVLTGDVDVIHLHLNSKNTVTFINI